MRATPTPEMQQTPRRRARPPSVSRFRAGALGALLAVTFAAVEAFPNAGDGDHALSELGLGITAHSGGGGEVGSLGLGLDGWYRPLPWLAGGVELQWMAFDNLEYCSNCFAQPGYFALAFAEARLIPRAVLSPYARLGFGLASLDYEAEHNRINRSLRPVAMLALGPQLTLWQLFVRVRGTATVTPPKSFLGWGLELGVLLDP